MEIIKSKYIGFCSGVKRCIKIAEKLLINNKKVYAWGELLHNDQEMTRLKKLGLNILNNVDNITEKSCLIIRTHGVEKENLKKFENKDIKIIDGTCPIVKRNQEIVINYSYKGYDVIIYGDKEHPEIKALVSYINPKVKKFVINSVKEIEYINLDINAKVILIAQTTKELQEYKNITDLLTKKYKRLKSFNTICKETILRETSTAELAKKVDSVIIIGGKNSANTKKLNNIASKFTKTIFYINSVEELELNKLKKYKSVGIISGASTPNWLIDNVVKKLSISTSKVNSGETYGKTQK